MTSPVYLSFYLKFEESFPQDMFKITYCESRDELWRKDTVLPFIFDEECGMLS